MLFGKMLKRFMYPHAGQGAPAEVRAAIQRWRKLPIEVRAKTSLWAWLLGPDGTPPYKMDPNQIKVEKQPVAGRKCANCQRYYTHVVTGTGLCDKVAGVWAPSWWCDQWERPAPKEIYQAYQKGESLNR